MFNYSEGLQNPELVLSRLTQSKEKIVRRSIAQILDLENENAITRDADSIKLKMPGIGKVALRDLADGYRATFLWLTDFLGWAASRNPFRSVDDIKGIVLVDALEEHLHPKWQRTIVSQLHKAYKNIQFIIATHSPLVAAGTTDFVNSQLVELEGGNEVDTRTIDKSKLKGMRADQILRSEAFDLPATASPDSVNNVTKYYELKLLKKSKRKLTKEEARKLVQLKKQIKVGLEFGDTPFEEEVEKAVQIVLKGLLGRPPSEIHKLAARRKLVEIFKK